MKLFLPIVFVIVAGCGESEKAFRERLARADVACVCGGGVLEITPSEHRFTCREYSLPKGVTLTPECPRLLRELSNDQAAR